jgi:hypothetical protein
MDLDKHILVPNLGENHKAGTLAKSVNEFDVTVFPQVSSLSCVCDALQQLLRIFDGKRWPLNLVVHAIDNNDRWLPDL